MSEFSASGLKGLTSPSASRFDGNPIIAMERAHDGQLELCRALEAIADSLPGKVDRQRCILAARALWPQVRGVHSFEENIVFPRLERILANADGISHTLERLRHQHRQDEGEAEELTDLLFRLGAGDKGVDMEAASAMLRGFLESMRSHIAFEREHVVALARSSGAFAETNLPKLN